MKKEEELYFQEENSWFNCIGEIQTDTISTNQHKFDTKKQVERNHIQSNKQMQRPVHACFDAKAKYTQEQMFKRSRQPDDRDEQEEYTENSSSNEIKSKKSDSKEDVDKNKGLYQDKQHIYSKNYRERKKQKAKSLEQENDFLKKKIQDLEFRLREMELQINRLKFMPEEKQYTVEQLNSEFLEKVTIIMEKNKDNPAEFKTKYNPEDPFYAQFMTTYAKHGFGGSNKTQILNYYYNQILEAMMRDSERYFCLMCLNAESGYELKGFPEYEIISSVFFDILKPDEDKLKRLQFFSVNLHPLVKGFFMAVKEFDNKFKEIMISMHKIHQFMRQNYPSNFDFARMRIVELEAWFQKQKYTKLMRNLRVMWLNELKKDKEEFDKKKVTGSKKKKVNAKEQ